MRRLAVTVLVVAFSIAVPLDVASASDPAVPSPPRLETFTFPSSLVDTSSPGGRLVDDRVEPTVKVLLPAGYDSDPDATFPVLWLLHGANSGSDSWFRSIIALMEGFPGIIVMPDGGTFGMYMDWWNGGARGGPAWATYHTTHLMNHVEATYRIRPGRRWHAMAGISMGGQGTLRYASMLPGYFGSIATLSAAMPDTRSPVFEGGVGLVVAAGGAPDGASYHAVWGPSGSAYAHGTSPQSLVRNLEHTRVFMTSGSGVNCPQDPINPEALVLDSVTEAALNLLQHDYVADAQAAGVDITAQTTCGIHTFGVWDRAVVQALDWGFFEPVAEAPDEWTYRTIAAAGTMWDIGFDFADPPGRAVDFTRDGSTLTGAGAGELTLVLGSGCRRTESLPFEISLTDGWDCAGTDAPAADVAEPGGRANPPPVADVSRPGSASPAQLSATGVAADRLLMTTAGLLGLRLMLVGAGRRRPARRCPAGVAGRDEGRTLRRTRPSRDG